MRFVVISDLHLQIPNRYNLSKIYSKYWVRSDNWTRWNRWGYHIERDFVLDMQQYYLDKLANDIIKLDPNCLFILGDIFDKTNFENPLYDEEKLN